MLLRASAEELSESAVFLLGFLLYSDRLRNFYRLFIQCLKKFTVKNIDH